MAKNKLAGAAFILPMGLLLLVLGMGVEEAFAIWAAALILAVGVAILVWGIVGLRANPAPPSAEADLTPGKLAQLREGGLRGLWGRVVDSVRPTLKDDAYWVRLVAGLFALGFFFAIGSLVAGKTMEEFSGFVRQVGRTFYYSSKEEIEGSAGQGAVSAVLAAGAFVAAISIVVRKWRLGARTLPVLGQILLLTGVAFGVFGGFLGNGVIQFFVLGYLRARFLWWFLMPLVFAGGLWGAFYYAKEGTSGVGEFS